MLSERMLLLLGENAGEIVPATKGSKEKRKNWMTKSGDEFLCLANIAGA